MVNENNIIVSKNQSVVQGIIDWITGSIVKKELKPGDKLPPEPELAAQLGTARSSVREAIKILSYLGVLESKRGEGTSVCNGFKESMIDPMIYGIILNQDEPMNDLMELREMTETGIMRLAVKKYTAEDDKELTQIFENMKKIVNSEGRDLEEMIDDFFNVDNEFHNKISELGKNPMADKISRVVRTLTYAMRYGTVRIMFETHREKELVGAHETILQTLRNGNEESLNDVVATTYFKEVFQDQNEIS